MIKLSCVACGQRYYGAASQGLTCDFCHGPIEDTGWYGRGSRAGMPPLPAVLPPLPAYPQSSGGGPYGRTSLERATR